MSRRLNRVANDDVITDILQNSDYEDEAEDILEFQNSDEYIPDHDQDSKSDSSNSDNEIVSTSQLRGHGNMRTSSRSRGRSCSRRTRGRSLQSRISGEFSRRPRCPVANDPPKDWAEKAFPSNLPLLSEPSYLIQDASNYCKLDFFVKYFDEDLITTIVQKTNQTAVQKTGRSLMLTNGECNVFIGISMMMACVGYPITRMYWENKWRIPLVAENMSRNRFFILRNSLKFVFDDDISQAARIEDKLWKVRPLLTKMINACNKEVKAQHISIDEMMIPFTGACPMRQYVPGKPHPVGLKAYVLANPDGTVCDFVVYQGDTTFSEFSATTFSQGEKAVLKLTEAMVPGHLVYFDRFFTTVRLVEELKSRGIESTGTLMKNRIPGPAREKLESDQSLNRSGRGSCQVIVRDDDQIAITKWYDNKPVILMSSVFANEDSDICRRYNKKEKIYINVNRPEVIKMYNRNMGGVDLADRQLSVCPSRSRTKKWTIRMFSHMLDLAVVNSWTQYKKEERTKGTDQKYILQLRHYKMEIAVQLIEKNTAPFELSEVDDDEEPVKKRGRPAPVPIPSKIRRTQGSTHIPEVTEKQHRCRMTNCDKKSTVKCISCNVFLCLTFKRNCFKNFHE